MDTLTHITMGAGLGALAYLDPAVSSNEVVAQAVMIGTVLGSNAPDFDFVYRLKSKGSYYRNHRGASHSLPALPLWGLAISGAILAFFPGVPFLHLFFWTFLAVLLHVFFDLFNMHGTQVMLPFSPKWLALDAIPLIDPFILIVHFFGFVIIPYFHPGVVFLSIYCAIFIYMGIRFISSHMAKKHLQSHFPHAERIKILPQTMMFKWEVIIESQTDFLFGTFSVNSLFIEHSFSKKIAFPDLVLDSKKHPNISDFLSSTHYAFPFVEKKKQGYLVYWKDLRFRTKKFFPNSAIISFSSGKQQKGCYIGKMNSLQQYKKVIKGMKQMANEN